MVAQTTLLLLLVAVATRTEAMLLSMLLGRRPSSFLPKPIIKVYRDFDSGKGLRSGIKLGIDASFGHKHKEEEERYESRGLGVKYLNQHDDYKLQHGDYDHHRYHKSPSITFEIKAPEDSSDNYRSIFKTSFPREPTSSSYNLRPVKSRRRRPSGIRGPIRDHPLYRDHSPIREHPPYRDQPPARMPSYRKELMVPSYKYGPYKGHTLMGFTYDNSEKEAYAKS